MWYSPYEITKTLASVLRAWSGFDSLTKTLCEFRRAEAYLIGGRIRDAIANPNSVTNDFDFIVTGEQQIDFVERLAMRGRVAKNHFGTPRWYPAECASEYADVVPLKLFNSNTARSNRIEQFSPEADMTANAIAMDLRTGEIIDPLSGVSDIINKITRAVDLRRPDSVLYQGGALTRRGVEWIRMLHYTQKLGFSFEEDTWVWISDNRDYIEQIGEFSNIFFRPRLETFMCRLRGNEA